MWTGADRSVGWRMKLSGYEQEVRVDMAEGRKGSMWVGVEEGKREWMWIGREWRVGEVGGVVVM